MSRNIVATIGHCRDKDGKWNGAKTMATLTRRSEKQIRALWERIRFLNEDCAMNLRDATDIAIKEHA